MEPAERSSDTYTALFATGFSGGGFQVFFWYHDGFLIGEECRDRGGGTTKVPDGCYGAASIMM